jgi:hypothetical protein
MIPSAYPLDGGFWRTANGNFLEMAVLEWCKLLADRRGAHFWKNVVSDPAAFEAGLLRRLRLDTAAFEGEIDDMRRYRDHYIAHADSDPKIYVPHLDVAKRAVWFYFAHVVNQEVNSADLTGFPLDLDAGYKQCEEEAKAIYRHSGS